MEVDYSTIEAGRDLDALIAEKIFGLKVERFEVEPSDYIAYAEPGNPAAGWWFVSDYSTDIAAAWEVVEKIAARNGDTIVSVTHNSADGQRMGGEAKYFCTIEDVSDGIAEWEASADAAPLAICRAALKAVSDKE